jgi:phosphoglycolate phosphatase
VKRYDHIIWDWNGTLLNDVHLCVDVINDMLRQRRMREIDVSTYQAIFDFPVHTYYQRLGFDFRAEPFEALAAEYCAQYEARVRTCELHTDTISTLEHISKEGVTQSVLSASEQQWLSGALTHFEIAGYFEETVGLSDRYAKGKVEAGRALVERVGIEPSRTLLVGDTAHDREVAAALGVACVLISHGHHSRERLAAVHHHVVESLGAIASLAWTPPALMPRV